MFKPFDVVLDVSNKSMNDMFEVSTNDLNTIRLDIKVREGLKNFDLTGKIVRLAIQKPDKNVVFQTGGVTNGAEGLCEIILSRQANVIDGRHEAELMIFEGDEAVAVTTKFFYNVKKALLNDNAVKSTSDFPAINQAIEAGQKLEGIDLDVVADAGAAVQGIQSQVDQLVINGDSSAEAAQMRVDTEGVTHVTAKARADSDYNKVASRLADIAVSPKQYGAIGDGVADDTEAIRTALSNNDVVNISGGTFLVSGKIRLEPGKGLKGDKTGTILINSATSFTVFELTYLNEVFGFNIVQTNNLWNGNIFEVSSKTLESTVAPQFINLRIKLHDFKLSTVSGTFYAISCYQYDESLTKYRVYGMWNSYVYNINHKGYLEYFCRAYCYRPNTSYTRPWMTVNEFKNVVCDYVGYGWFGSKEPATMADERYYNDGIRAIDCNIQCYIESKNFAFISGGYAEFYDCIPYDWGAENTSHQNAFLIRNGSELPNIKIRNTVGAFDLLNPVVDGDTEFIINKCVFDQDGLSKEKTTKSFYIGDVGGTTYPRYKRIAKFIPSAGTVYATSFKLHNEYNGTMPVDFYLKYDKATDTLLAGFKHSNSFLVDGLTFYYQTTGDGYLEIYLKFSSSGNGWYITYETPPLGNASKYFIYLNVKDFGGTLNTTGMKVCTPSIPRLYASDVSAIAANAFSSGAVGYDGVKGLLNFGRISYGATYIPIVRTLEYTAITATDIINIPKVIWEMKPKITIQPLQRVTLIPFPNTIGFDVFTANDLEVGKKYLITFIYNEM